MTESQFVSQLIALDGALFEGFLIILCALPLARLAPLPREMQPLVWFGVLARELARKVNHPSRGPRQQLIAGIMATVLLVLPFWLIVAFLLDLAAFPWFFEFLILYLCLSDASFAQVAEEVQRALGHGDKDRARKLLSQYLSRDTTELSETGLAKATIEKLVTAPIYGTAGVVFFYALAGAPMVLLVRMLKQLELVWPPMSPDFRAFVAPVNQLVLALLYIPAWLWSLTLAIVGGPSGFKALLTPRRWQPLSNAMRAAYVAATVLNTELGGPHKYRGSRVAIDKVGKGPLPDTAKIGEAIKLSNRACFSWLAFLLFLPFAWTLLRYSQTL
ncbi:cobalamin biosynthesis protein [Shewanella sp. FJAT-52076]|uniref:cobalamin biosynthesis protein CobD/CbiB n=1 Tax=Shewanella sp. FJAT-52076 TaxID=2864202 RepID=UPI001C656049|nr:cobalamin biosynthesis protein [Shewanella sp. FJAT-52076]QYJ76217.1 cobalamin biosynthesis protein [Shewanella sp. FJAT-52076]